MTDDALDPSALRVLFIHGKESSPLSRKATALKARFAAHAVPMNTDEFEGSVAIQEGAIRSTQPHVLVGSSFGGAVACALLARGHWKGPTLLLAQAGLRYGCIERLPQGVPVVLVHGTRDSVIACEDSQHLAETGSPQCTVLHTPNDDHALTETTGSGALIEHVLEVARLGGLAVGG